MPIDGSVSVEQLVGRYPEIVGWLSERGLRCVSCGEPFWGTLEELAHYKGFSQDRIDRLLQQLNELLESTHGGQVG